MRYFRKLRHGFSATTCFDAVGDNPRCCRIRCGVTSADGMTAGVYPFDPQFLSRVATRIVNEVNGINRVVYDYTSKPPGTIEWE